MRREAEDVRGPGKLRSTIILTSSQLTWCTIQTPISRLKTGTTPATSCPVTAVAGHSSDHLLFWLLTAITHATPLTPRILALVLASQLRSTSSHVPVTTFGAYVDSRTSHRRADD